MGNEVVPANGAAPRRTNTRGVSYPSTHIGAAINLAKKYFDAERKAEAPVAAAIGHFGYSETSSGGRQAISTLLQFGLLEDIGRGNDRHVKLTDNALTVLLAEPDGEDFFRAMRACVASPKIYQELFRKWPDALPSDQSISFYLAKDKNFNVSSIPSFLKDLRLSMSLAGVDHPAELLTSVDDSEPVKPVGMKYVGDIVRRQREANAGRTVQAAPASPFVVGRALRPIGDPGERSLGTFGFDDSQGYPVPSNAAQSLLSNPNEKEWMRGSLSKTTEFRINVSGPITGREVGRLIRLLEAQKEVLEEDSDSDDGLSRTDVNQS